MKLRTLYHIPYQFATPSYKMKHFFHNFGFFERKIKKIHQFLKKTSFFLESLLQSEEKCVIICYYNEFLLPFLGD